MILLFYCVLLVWSVRDVAAGVECGSIAVERDEDVLDSKMTKLRAVPWHAGIYRKTTVPYQQICSGTLVSTKSVISAAHCFWSDISGQREAAQFAVALGKVYRPWQDSRDVGSQHSNVTEIHIPSKFRGAANNYQNDIAIVILETATVYQSSVIRPACIDFDVHFISQQLQEGKLGKLAGWGRNSTSGGVSSPLRVLELPYVGYERCFEGSPPDFREYFTDDKFCAGFLNGTAQYLGYGGGGLTFAALEPGRPRHYLRGVASTAPCSDTACESAAPALFTDILSHEKFIKGHVVY